MPLLLYFFLFLFLPLFRLSFFVFVFVFFLHPSSQQTRVLRQSSDEKSYHIFYQLLAGLTKEERSSLITYNFSSVFISSFLDHHLRFFGHTASLVIPTLFLFLSYLFHLLFSAYHISFSSFFLLILTARLNLDGYNVHNLRYLNRGDTRQNEAEDAARFEDWKVSIEKKDYL